MNPKQKKHETNIFLKGSFVNLITRMNKELLEAKKINYSICFENSELVLNDFSMKSSNSIPLIEDSEIFYSNKPRINSKSTAHKKEKNYFKNKLRQKLKI